MSVADNITRLTNIRNRQRDKLAGMNLVDSAAKFETITQAIEGIKDQGAVTATVKEGGSYTIPAGYHNGGGVVTGVAGGGNYELETPAPVTPTKSQQSVTPSQGKYGLTGVVVNPIPAEYQDVSDVTATAPYVRAGDVFVDSEGTVTAGTMPKIEAMDGKINALETESLTIPEGYHNGNGKVTITEHLEQALAAL